MLSLGLTSEWGTSVSVRTANDNSEPLDYELSIKLDDIISVNAEYLILSLYLSVVKAG